ncbi:GNAT family N-acetyltransferase [Falsiroseomonas bella]|uniref:GNAT family N-acetyltransferase n=1 Tax=Falsiroseomonas bella TaxID=2184016 RepID=A0A317FB40_9PROT|nr:GNAT family N-acetyltransferase [Falsiroseomonas bella]
MLRPAADLAPGYADALRRGFEPSTFLGPALAERHLAAIAEDAAAFCASLEDPVGEGSITLPDGRQVPRLPGFTRWIEADGFCGVVHFRRQKGTAELPSHVLGHIGYLVVPWRQREGHATRALGLLLKEVAPLGLPWVELSTDPDNIASIRVIAANGGRLVERFTRPASFGGGEALRFRIALAP